MDTCTYKVNACDCEFVYGVWQDLRVWLSVSDLHYLHPVCALAP